MVRRHQDAVYNLLYQITRNPQDAADLAQDAFVKAYRKLEQYQPKYAFRNWVMTIAANTAKNRFRSLARRRRAEEEHWTLRELNSAGKDDVQFAELEEALASLPVKWRTPLVLKYMEGLSYDEIAAVLKIGVSAAKMRTLRGRERLRELLAPDAALIPGTAAG